MDMIIVVMAVAALFFTQCIHDRIIRGRNCVNDSFFNESLQGPVNSYPVKMSSANFFYIGVGECVFTLLKQLKDFHPVFRNVELAVF